MEGGHSIYGLDRIIFEGTPTDGSRNFYSDMVRATLHFDAAKKLDVFALYDSGRSDLRWGNSRSRGRSLNCINMTDTSDLDEWGGGLVYSQNAFDGDLADGSPAARWRTRRSTTEWMRCARTDRRSRGRRPTIRATRTARRTARPTARGIPSGRATRRTAKCSSTARSTRTVAGRT